MLQFKVVNVVFGSPDSKDLLPEIDFSVNAEIITVTDLITRTVKLQIAGLLESPNYTVSEIRSLLDQQYLDDEGLAEQAASRMFPKPESTIVKFDIDTDREIARAQRAYIQARFFIFINGRQISGLDEIISSNELIEVKFMRLKPVPMA